MKASLFSLLILTGLLHAEDPAAAAKTGPPMRLLALGEPPPFRQEVKGDRRVEIEAEKGALPPHQIAIAENPAVPLTLCQPAPLAHVPPAPHVSLLDQAATWTTLDIPEALRAKPKLALFWRDPGKTWDTPRNLLLDDSAEAFPAGQVRFVNLLPTTAAIKIGETTHELAAGKVWLCPAPPAGQALQIVFRAADGSWIPVHSATFEPAPDGTRMEVIVYRADTPTARRPAKALVLRGPVTTTERPAAAAMTAAN
ncbi:hypothetical protein [Luteolibacter sp. LG18]|uniref:hypothetical protein n=1 Tax=Luteolibacter sp. LG18 TaxID=2819286 RepID=UPI002B2A8196|nr:hypothetical protein llg_14960 [Luteolibacter sp. LG18]